MGTEKFVNKEKNKKKAFVWNMIGSTLYSASSFWYLLVITRVCGVNIAGFYSLSFATAQLLLNIARYGMRTYQATDLTDNYLFSEYVCSRVITCVAATICGIIYSILEFDKSFVIISIFIIGMKLIDAVEDVFHGHFQKKYNVQLMGKMLALRNAFTIVIFTILILLTKDLLITFIVSMFSSLVVCLGANMFFKNKYIESETMRIFDRKNVLSLLKMCTPLFVGTFLSLLLYNVPKYAMSNVLTDDYQTYYSIMFMPSFVIILMCEFVFKPTITTIAGLWRNGDLTKFYKYILKIMGVIFSMGVVVVLLGHVIGRRILELVYGVNLEPYKIHFVVLLIAGGISAAVYMLYNILISIRMRNSITVVYLIAAVITVAVARPMVNEWGIMGACLNYMLSGSILLVAFVTLLTYLIKKGSAK